MTSTRRLSLATLRGLLLLLLMARLPVAVAQESVRPGINDSYQNPQIDQWVPRLESEQRAIYKYRHAIVAALSLDSGMEVADVGAGTGFLARLMAFEVGDEGRAYAVDIAQTFLDHIAAKAADEGLGNLTTVLGDQKTTNLQPSSVDLVVVTDTYHHFEYPDLTLASIRQALRPGGRLVIVDFERVAGVSTQFALDHVRAGKGTVTDEVKNAGFDLLKEIPLMKDQFFLVFERRDD